jgi:hypothetical protein
MECNYLEIITWFTNVAYSISGKAAGNVVNGERIYR